MLENVPVTAGGFNLLPTGIIVMWNGTKSTVPAGWAMCDGTNNTPDLRDKFIVGSGKLYSTSDTGGYTTTSFTLATNNIPPHHHNYSYYDVISVNQNFASNFASSRDSGLLGGLQPPIPTTTCDVGTGNNCGPGTDPVTVPILPPYYALCYIMKL